MTWTYTQQPFPQPWPFQSGQLAPQPCIDTVRFLLGDVDADDPQLADGEIQGLLAQNSGSPYQAAIEGCRSLATFYARQTDKSVGDLHILASERWKAYSALVKDLEVQALRHDSPVPYLGGMRVSDKQIDRDDDDIVAPDYWEGMMDDPGTAPDYGLFTDGFGGFDRSIPG